MSYLVFQRVRLWIIERLGIEKKMKKKNNFFWWLEIGLGIKMVMKNARKTVRSY